MPSSQRRKRAQEALREGTAAQCRNIYEFLRDGATASRPSSSATGVEDSEELNKVTNSEELNKIKDSEELNKTIPQSDDELSEIGEESNDEESESSIDTDNETQDYEEVEDSATTVTLPGPPDISRGPVDSPVQTKLTRYPTKMQGKFVRSFRPSWFERYPWIEYSELKDAAFCYPCRHFVTPGQAADNSYTTCGFSNWKKATYKDSGFSIHQRSITHIQASQAWNEYRDRALRSKTVMDLLTDERTKKVSRNRSYIKAVADVLRFTAVHRIAQRGHDETRDSLDPGNFRSLLLLLANYNTTIAERLTNLPRNSKYTSQRIQTEILKEMSEMVKAEIINEVKESQKFSVLVDETKDCSKMEQMSLVLRYFRNGSVCEGFIGFLHAVDLSGAGLAEQLLAELRSHSLDVTSNLVGQGYDGASVMSGKHKGVAALVRREAPKAVYIHCHAHRLNLVLVDVVKAIPEVNEFFDLMERLYVFLSGSVVHTMWLDIQKELYPDEQPRELQRLSDTRWACRYVSCKVLRNRLPAVVKVLQTICETERNSRAIDSRALLFHIDSKFVLTLCLMTDILGKTNGLSKSLQAVDIDLAKASSLISIVERELSECRTDSSCFDNVVSSAGNICQSINIDFDRFRSESVTSESDSSNEPNRKRKRCLPQRLKDSVVLSTIGERADLSNLELYHNHIFLPVMDNLINEFDRRFSEAQLDIMGGIEACNPSHENFLVFDKLVKMATLYDVEVEDLKHEVHQAKRLVARTEQKPCSLLSFTSFLLPYKEAFPCLFSLCSTSVCLPVSSASCERSFSALRQIKTYVRNSIGQSKLSSVAVLAIEKERALSLSLDDVVNKFATSHNNRRILLR